MREIFCMKLHYRVALDTTSGEDRQQGQQACTKSAQSPEESPWFLPNFLFLLENTSRNRYVTLRLCDVLAGPVRISFEFLVIQHGCEAMVVFITLIFVEKQ